MNLLKSATNGWNNFFFKEESTDGIALFRIVWLGMLLFYFFLDYQNLADSYGPHALLSLNTVREQGHFHLNLFHLFKPSYVVTQGLFIVLVMSLILSLVGLYTRASLIIAFACMTSFHQRNIWLTGSAELLMRSVTLLLICAPSGNSLSIDSLLGRYLPTFKRPRSWSVWALRLIQLQFVAACLWTSWSELRAGHWIVGLIIVAISFGLWIERLRKPSLIVGSVFYLVMSYSLRNPFYGAFMMTILMTYIKPSEIAAFVQNAIGLNNIKERIEILLRGHHETNH